MNQTSKVLFSPLMRKSKGFIQLEYKFSPAPEGGFEVLMGKVLRGKAWENKCKPRFPLLQFQQHWGRASVSP